MPQHNTDRKKILLEIFYRLNRSKNNEKSIIYYEKLNSDLKDKLDYINNLREDEINEEEKILLIRNISNIINDSRNCIIKTNNNKKITNKQIQNKEQLLKELKEQKEQYINT